MNTKKIVERIVDKMLGKSIGDRKHTDAEHKFRCAVADFLNVIDPRRSTRLNGDVLRQLGHEMYAYATILDPSGDKVNLTSYTEQLDRVIRGKVSETILEMMELMSDDKLATMSARKLLADHLAQGEVPDHLREFAWPDGVH